jgi:hypothetical protein
MTLSIVSLVVALVALVINVSGLVRRPRIVARWGEVAGDDGYGPVREGLSIIVTARRRPIEIDEIGIVLLTTAPRRHQFPEWLHEQRPFRYPLSVDSIPHRLQDGESLRAYVDLDHAQEEASGPGVAYPYVLASGTVYLARKDSRLGRWLTPRQAD